MISFLETKAYMTLNVKTIIYHHRSTQMKQQNITINRYVPCKYIFAHRRWIITLRCENSKEEIINFPQHTKIFLESCLHLV